MTWKFLVDFGYGFVKKDCKISHPNYCERYYIAEFPQISDMKIA